MKKTILTLLAVLLTLTASAQGAKDLFTVNRTNGSSTDYSLSDYDRITYVDNKQYIHKLSLIHI